MAADNRDTDTEERNMPLYTIKSDYVYSIASTMLNYRIIFLFAIILIFIALNKLDPYSDNQEMDFALFILFAYLWLALETSLSLFCVLSYKPAQILSKIIIGIYFAEGIMAAINPHTLFGMLFTVQLIVTHSMSIYSSFYLLYLGKLKKPLLLFLLFQIYSFCCQLYSLTLSFIYTHNDIAGHATPDIAYLTLLSLPRLLLASEVVIDKLDFVAFIVFFEQKNIYQSRSAQIAYAVLVGSVSLVSVFLYAYFHEEHDHEEMDGCYPYALWLEFHSYLDFPIVFVVILWLLCSRVYIYDKKLQFGTLLISV